MSRGQVVYTLHLWPPLGHAAHYTGTTPERRLGQRLTDHALGRGARLTQVQIERGGWWVLAQTQPGGRSLERRLKQHGAARRCEVCKAVGGYQAGDLPAADALARAGWGRSNPAQRSLLLDIFGLPEPPAALQDARSRRPGGAGAGGLALLRPGPATAGRARTAAVGPARPGRSRTGGRGGGAGAGLADPAARRAAAAGTRTGGRPVNPARTRSTQPRTELEAPLP